VYIPLLDAVYEESPFLLCVRELRAVYFLDLRDRLIGSAERKTGQWFHLYEKTSRIEDCYSRQNFLQPVGWWHKNMT